MSGKMSLTAEAVEELMESQAILDHIVSGLQGVFDALERNEQIDHDNDKLRTEAIGFILKSMESYNARDYEGMQKFNHAAVQRLNEQGVLDYKDDKPRSDVRIMLMRVQMNAVRNLERLRKITGRLDAIRLEDPNA